MFITYRRTDAVVALFTLAAGALAVTVLAAAVAATVSIAALAMGAAVYLARAVLPTSWRHRTGSSAASRAHDTIEATVVSSTGSDDDRELVPRDSEKTTIG